MYAIPLCTACGSLISRFQLLEHVGRAEIKEFYYDLFKILYYLHLHQLNAILNVGVRCCLHFEARFSW